MTIKEVIQPIVENLGYTFYSVWTDTLDKSTEFDYPCVWWLDPRIGYSPQRVGLKRTHYVTLAFWDKTDSDRTPEQRDQAHSNAQLMAEKVIYKLAKCKEVSGIGYDFKFVSAIQTNTWDTAIESAHGMAYEIEFIENGSVCHQVC